MRKLYIGDKNISGGLKLDDNFVYVPFPQPFEIEYLVVAGGGGGGNYTSYNAGGGGAGRFVSSSYEVEIGNTFSVTVGNGGSVNNDGGDSRLVGSGLTIIMNGGGGGGTYPTDGGDGRDGGSGGGGAQQWIGGWTGRGGTGTNAGLPSDLVGLGTNGVSAVAGSLNAGAGGGVSVQWLDGITYSVGGTAGGAVRSTPGSGGRGGTNSAAATNGLSGIVKIRYIGQPKATGGTITQSGGYTYHTFTSNDTFTVVSSFDVV